MPQPRRETGPMLLTPSSRWERRSSPRQERSSAERWWKMSRSAWPCAQSSRATCRQAPNGQVALWPVRGAERTKTCGRPACDATALKSAKRDGAGQGLLRSNVQSKRSFQLVLAAQADPASRMTSAQSASGSAGTLAPIQCSLWQFIHIPVELFRCGSRSQSSISIHRSPRQ